MKKNLFIIIILFLSTNIISFAQPIFNISDENERFLRYFRFENVFDSVTVGYELGELITSNNNEEIKLIFKERMIQEPHYMQSISDSGLDYFSAYFTHTNNFIVPDSSTLSFYRYVFLDVLGTNEYALSAADSTDPFNEKPLDSHDFRWVCEPGEVMDDMEFRVQLMDASNDTALVTLDSVGVNRNPNSIVAGRYGARINETTHSVNIPHEYWGKEAYIRILPRRVGDTPFGMVFRIVPWWFNKSYCSGLVNGFMKLCDYETEVEPIYEDYKQQFFNYADSLYALEELYEKDLSHIAFKNHEEHRNFLNRYFDTTHVETDSSSYIVSFPKSSLEKRATNHFNPSITNDKSGNFIKIEISPNPKYLAEGQTTLRFITDGDYQDVLIKILDINGKVIFTQNFPFIRGVTMTKGFRIFNEINAGTYFVTVESKGVQLGSSKFIKM